MSIRNEEGVLKAAIVHMPISEAGSELVESEMYSQHDAYVRLLKESGVELYYPDLAEFRGDKPWSKDVISLYCRDPVVVIGDTAYYAHNQMDPRARELHAYQNVLHQIRGHVSRVVDLSSNVQGHAELHGGDIRIAHDGNVLMGLRRAATVHMDNDRILREALRLYLGDEDINAHFIEYDTGAESNTHLDGCCLAPLPGPSRAVLVSKAFVASYDLPALKRLFNEVIFVPEKDDKASVLATNFQVLNPETIVSHTGCPETNKLLLERGYDVRVLPWDSQQTGAAWRCMTGEVHRE